MCVTIDISIPSLGRDWRTCTASHQQKFGMLNAAGGYLKIPVSEQFSDLLRSV